MILIESDNAVYCERENVELKKQLYANPEAIDLPESQVGRFKASSGICASCVRMIEPIEMKTLDLLELENNECAVSLTITSFPGHEGEMYLFVGTIKDYFLEPKSFTSCYIHTYGFKEQGKKLELLHKTLVEDIPYCFVNFKGRLLAGIGTKIR